MSLYGPKIRLPKVDAPIPGNPSWNFDKERKWILGAIVAIIVIVIIWFAGPILLSGAGDALGNTFNPAIQVSWKNNPLNLKTSSVDSAQLSIVFTNTSKQTQDIYFALNYPSTEIIEFCPEYTLKNVAPGDSRTVNCTFRRNGEIFSGTYSIDVNSNLGTAKTKLEIIAK